MREILFRGKRIDNGEWIEGFYYKEPAPPSCFSVGDDTHWIVFVDPTFLPDWGLPYRMVRVDVEPGTVGQYTGMTDNNGKKIFEGDIVEGLDFTAEDGGYGVVTFDDGAFEVVGSCDNNIVGTFHENYYGRDFEVIGNIHDNPDLLKGGE
jgi:uncharacterized phage protein (TIGR01671 family)